MTTREIDALVDQAKRWNRDGIPTAITDHMMIDRLVVGIEALTKANAELREALKAILEALRIHAPGTPLNNHHFDALGIKAYAALARKP